MVEWGWLKFLMELQILLSHSILTWYGFKATTWLSSIDHWITRSTSSLIFFLNCRGKLGTKYLAIYTILHLVGIVLQIQLSLNLLAFGIFSLVSLCVLYYPLSTFSLDSLHLSLVIMIFLITPVVLSSRNIRDTIDVKIKHTVTLATPLGAGVTGIAKFPNKLISQDPALTPS